MSSMVRKIIGIEEIDVLESIFKRTIDVLESIFKRTIDVLIKSNEENIFCKNGFCLALYDGIS